jgi:hypothetical protein
MAVGGSKAWLRRTAPISPRPAPLGNRDFQISRNFQFGESFACRSVGFRYDSRADRIFFEFLVFNASCRLGILVNG